MADHSQLILWRHAEAEDGFPGRLADADRALTPHGRKQAARMAKWLKERLPKDYRVLVSPARRTLQTAAALERPFETMPEVGLAATPHSLLAAAGWPDSPGVTIVIGHQPTLGQVVARLLSGNKDMEWSLKKGALVWIAGRLRDGEHEAVLRAAMTPEMV